MVDNLRNIKEYKVANLPSEFEGLLNSYAFKRLERITFLGILSPIHFRHLNSPLRKYNYNKTYYDGTRKDHSIGVALLIGMFCKWLNLSSETIKYAQTWALLHDIATWPLSHTGEAAFSKVTKTSAQKLRRMIITGNSSLSETYSVQKEIEKLGLDPQLLLKLYDKENSLGNNQKELVRVWRIIHSPITPDTLEGMWRVGETFNKKSIDPFSLKICLHENLFYDYLDERNSATLVKFWRFKSSIYKQLINKENVVRWESCWSRSIQVYFQNINLEESLSLTEKEIIETVLNCGLKETKEVIKYKKPMEYKVVDNKKKLHEVEINELNRFLVKSTVDGQLK